MTLQHPRFFSAERTTWVTRRNSDDLSGFSRRKVIQHGWNKVSLLRDPRDDSYHSDLMQTAVPEAEDRRPQHRTGHQRHNVGTVPSAGRR